MTEPGAEMVEIKEERLTAEEYIAFLGRTDLGAQYPRERFARRIATLVDKVSISLAARNEVGEIIGVCFGITDFSYWLFITDLGVDRAYVKRGIGKKLMARAHALAGGEKDIVMYTCANKNAVPFYRKIGMAPAADIMALDKIEWTPFTVGENNPEG